MDVDDGANGEGNMEVYFYKKPELKRPSMLAAWPGMGMLAKISADHLIKQLNAELFAEIRTARNDVSFEGGVGRLGVQTHRFYYWRGEGDRSLIVCSGEGQPSSLESVYGLANRVMDIAEDLGVSRVYTLAAIPNPFMDEPRVVGVVNSPELRKILEKYEVDVAEGEGHITGLNGLLIGVAKERGVEGICLLCEIRYMNLPQPRSSKRILEALAKLLGMQVDVTALESQAEKIEEGVERLRQRAISPDRRLKGETSYIS